MENQLKEEVRKLNVTEEYVIETRGNMSTLIKNGEEVDKFDASLVAKVIHRIALEVQGSAE